MDKLILVIWAAMIPLMPYALFRKKQNLLNASVVIFLILIIDVFMMLNTPNPDKIQLIQVTVP